MNLASARHTSETSRSPVAALLITAVALVVGGASAVAAFCLLRLIGLITNAVFYQRLSTTMGRRARSTTQRG